MAQLTITSHSFSHLKISITTTPKRLFPLQIPFPIHQKIQNQTTKPPHFSLSTIQKPRKSSLILNASTTSIPIETTRGVEEKNERVWKYPFSDVEVKKRRKFFGGERSPWNIRDVLKVGVAIVLHALCLFAPFTFTTSALIVAMILGVFTSLGITLSFHRNLAHRSFTLPKWLEYFWAYCGTHALQGSPMTWVSVHRAHHVHADKEKDPHSPIEGFWFSHINWIFDSDYFNNKIGGEFSNVGDMYKQPFYRFIEDTYLAHHIALATILYALGGFPWLVWGMGVRSVATNHVTFLVGSVLHIWGSRAYNTDDNSHNNWIMAFLTFGEGWHNNHHAFEFSARQGLEWYEIDVTWYVIKLLDILGLAKDIKLPTEAQKKKMLEKWN